MKKNFLLSSLPLVFLFLVAHMPGAGAATITVDNTSGNPATVNSLPWAVANADPGDVIEFNIPGAGVHTIVLSATLNVTQPITIDATTQPLYSGTPLIALTMGTPVASCFLLSAGNCTVKGFDISGFLGAGVRAQSSGNTVASCYITNCFWGVFIDGSNNLIGGAGVGNLLSGNTVYGVIIDAGSGNIVKGNTIGLDVAGTVAVPNATGIYLNSAGNTVGGGAAGERNIISGNTIEGINVSQPGNVIQGNYIGINSLGTAAVGNGGSGIAVSASNTQVGGSGAGEGNVIAGNLGAGLSIYSGTGNIVQGNIIGLNAAGTSAIGNAYQGIYVASASTSCTIGGSTPGAGNVISGNGFSGVELAAGNGNVVRGNYIGTDKTGTVAIGNTIHGLQINGADNTQVGGTAAGEGNLISGNLNTGVYVIVGTGTNFQGNIVGMDISATAALPNVFHGLGLATSGNTVGGSTAAARNIISGNGSIGVLVEAGTGNVIKGNYIGTDISGTVTVANMGGGVQIGGGTNTLVGGIAAGDGNLISARPTGVCIGISSSDGNTIQGNTIGMDVTGTVSFDVGGGIQVGSASNIIGGTTAGARNYIVATATDIGIYSGLGNVVQGNYLGLNKAGTAAFPGYSGVYVAAGAGAQIGGTAAGAGNVIAGHSPVGVQLDGDNNIVQGNIIGMDPTATVALANGYGVQVIGSGNTLGGLAPGAANIIAGNNFAAVMVGGTGTGNRISGNSIYNNGLFGIDLNNDYATVNDADDADSGPNDLLNFPVITSITQGGGNTTISGTYDGLASTTFSIELFANTALHQTGFGEGRTYLTSTSVTTNGAGHATFSVVVPGTYSLVAATATDLATNNTSEFSMTGPAFVNVTPQTFNICQNATAMSIKPLLRVADPQLGQTITWYQASAPANGTLNIVSATAASGSNNITPGGAITYVPALGYTGPDAFTIEATDGTSTVSMVVNVSVDPLPVINTITNDGPVCAGLTLNLSSAASGGTGTLIYSWTGPNAFSSTAQNPAITPVPAAAGGTYTLIVTDDNNCRATGLNTTSATIIPMTPIMGTVTLQVGASATILTDATPGGAWSSTDPAIAPINVSTRVVTPVSAGTAIISYTVGNCAATASVTVYGPVLCVGTTIQLSDAVAGGTWISGSDAIAKVNAISGVVTGIGAGSITIKHLRTSGVIINYPVVVNPLSQTIGVNQVCQGQTISMANSTSSGGAWSTNPGGVGIATVNSSGVVGGVSGGMADIVYLSSKGCLSVKTVTVKGIAPVVGTTTVCVGQTTMLSNSIAGGAWSSSSAAQASVSSLGMVKGIAQGTPRISYILPNGCHSTATVIVNPISATTGGTPGMCQGGSMTLANATPFGGVWSSSNSSVATVNGAGVVRGAGVGTANILFTTSLGCVATRTVTVNACREASPEANATIEDIAGIAPDIQLFPNPNDGTFTIRGGISAAEGEAMIQVVNMLGQVVYNCNVAISDSRIDKQVTLPGNLASGTYMLTLSSAGGKKVYHFVLGR